MAEVFLARAAGPMGFEKTVVVKRILPHLVDEPNFVSMFLSEARLAAQLNHPNVVQVFDFGEADGTYFLVMEYIDGVNLRVLFRKAMEQHAPLAFTLVARIVSLACEGLAYAHDFVDPATNEPMGLVHRDVSPDNVLIARNGSVRVVDFGIAKASNQTSFTKTGTVKGKFAYMPPEQLTGLTLDRRADVFALGILLYEMLTGRKPFDTSNEAVIVRAILYEDFPPAAQFRPDVPAPLQRILDRALAKARDQRYPDCRALQSDLERFILAQGEPVSQYQLAQLVEQVAPAPAFISSPPPSAPQLPPIGVVPTPATVPHEVEVEFSTAIVVTPAQPSFSSLGPRQRPPPPVPEFDPPVGTARPALGLPDLGAISLIGEQSAERPLPSPAARGPLMLVLSLAVGVGAGATWLVLKNRPSTPPPPPVVGAVVPEPATIAPPVVEQALAPEPVPVAPEPVAALAPARPRPKPPRAAPRIRPPPPVAASAKAEVTFRVRPFGSVWVDGAHVGDTPFPPISLPLGVHSIRVVNKDIGKEVTRQFEVKAGENVFRHSFDE